MTTIAEGNEIQDVEGWTCEQTSFMNTASRRTRGQESTVNFDHGPWHGTFEVQAEVGTGYFRESTTTYIPVSVIIRMMQHAGYVITRREGP